jgi:nucleotide-binding universal stress UspA family protein
MSFSRVLVAVDDSPAALNALVVALDAALEWGSTVRVVTVTEDTDLGRRLGAPESVSELDQRIADSGRHLLEHVRSLAEQRSLVIQSERLSGEPFREILQDARSWEASLIVMGRSDRAGPASPYLGSEVEHVLEFSEVPVLVVPRDPGTAREITELRP